MGEIIARDMPMHITGGHLVHIKYDDIRTVIDESSSRFAEWEEILNKSDKNMQDFTDSKQFSGETADCVKCYLNEVHGLLIQMIFAVFKDFSGKYILYRNGYYNIDGNKDTELYLTTLRELTDEYAVKRSRFLNVDTDVEKVVHSVSDIAVIPNPDYSALDSRMKNIYEKIRNLGGELSAYESDTVGTAEELMRLITSVTVLIKDYDKGKTVNPVTYESNDFLKSAALKEAVVCVSDSQDYLQEHMNEIEAAYEDEAHVREQIQKEYEEELAKEREKAGIFQIISGIGLAVVGVVAIVGTAGAATPLVAIGLTSGIGTCVFAGAEIIEGGGNYYYGSQGDITTKAFNPVRDTIFGGKQEWYDLTKNIFSTVAGLSVPAAKAGKTAVAMRRSKFYGSGIKDACNKKVLEKVAVDAGMKAAGKEFVKDKATDVITKKISDPMIEHLGDEIGMNDMQKEIAKKASSYVIDKGMDKGLKNSVGEFWDKPDGYEAYKDIRGIKKIEKEFMHFEEIKNVKGKSENAAEVLLHSEKPYKIMEEAEKKRSDYETWKTQQIFLQPD